MNLLICNPNFKKSELYLPYFWGRVREYCEFQDERDFSQVNFMDPIFEGGYLPDECEEVIKRHNFKNTDVLFISCYVWNWELNLAIAKRAKELNPKMVIIAGGPSILYKPWQDTSRFEVCDYVVPEEGEKTCADILSALLNGEDLSDLTNLVDPRHPRIPVKIPRQNLTNFRSPYVEYKDDYIRFIDKVKEELPGAWILAIWETNRGCPYKCSFCDWGGTNSKVKRYNRDIIEEEIEVICRDLKPNMIFNVDANFGILPEDIEYAESVGKARMKYGYPKFGLYFSSAKNHKKQVNQILKILYDYELLSFAQISFQHTDIEVLKSIDRDNIKVENLADTMGESFRLGLPVTANMILGNPGDTPAKWRKALGDMLETRFHDMRIHDFMMLPNAPAANPDYIEKYKIKTMERKHLGDEFGLLNLKNGSFNAHYILETSTFDKNDYVDMQIDGAMVIGYHILNLTKFICLYLKYYNDIPYMDFYDVLKETNTIKGHIKDLRSEIEKWVNGINLYKFAEFNSENFSYDVYLKVRGVLDLNNVMDDMFKLLVEKYNVPVDLAENLIKFQKRSIVGYWKQEDVEIDYNLTEIMKAIMAMHPSDKFIDIELKKEKTMIRSNQTHVGAFNKLLRKVDVSNIKDYDTWIRSKIHEGRSLRTTVNYYNEILENK